MSTPPTYQVEAVLSGGALCDARLELPGKSLLLSGRFGERTEIKLAEEALESGGFPVLLGSGMGHALQRLASSGKPFAVVDKESAILEITGLRETFAAKGGVWLDGADPFFIFKELEKMAEGRNFAPAALPAYQRLDPAHYGLLRKRLSEPPPERLAGARYKKFTGEFPRILLLTSKLFLMGEVVAACERLGAPYRYVDLGADEAEYDAFVEKIVSTVADFRPDFVLTMNHLGVDREGVLLDLLERLELPLASWFFDNPELMLFQYATPCTDLTAIFSWDADNVAPLRERGFPHVFYLPLATDETRFKPPARIDPKHPWRAAVSFVGNSMVHKARLRYIKAAPPTALLRKASEVAAAFGEHPERSVKTFLLEQFPELAPLYEAMETEERKSAFEAGLVWDSTRLYRAECVGRLLPFRPLIVGDDGWLETFPGEGGSWRRLSELTYYDDLPRFYPLTDVNFNVTSRQMKGAVNQRVFDVPACGAFLLTDYRAQMEALFEPGREMIAYSDPDEIEDLVRYYLNHPDERKTIVRAGRRRALAQHTYAARVKELFSVMKKTFGG